MVLSPAKVHILIELLLRWLELFKASDSHISTVCIPTINTKSHSMTHTPLKRRTADDVKAVDSKSGFVNMPSAVIVGKKTNCSK